MDLMSWKNDWIPQTNAAMGMVFWEEQAAGVAAFED